MSQYDKVREELVKLLGDDKAVERLMQNVTEINQQIIDNDMVRRTAKVDAALNETNLLQAGGTQVKITQRTLQVLADVILRSDFIQNLMKDVETLKRDLEKVTKDHEIQILRLKDEISKLAREEDVKISERIAQMPANNVLTLDIDSGWEFGKGSSSYTPREMTPQEITASNTMHEVNMLTSKIIKDMSGGK